MATADISNGPDANSYVAVDTNGDGKVTTNGTSHSSGSSEGFLTNKAGGDGTLTLVENSSVDSSSMSKHL